MRVLRPFGRSVSTAAGRTMREVEKLRGAGKPVGAGLSEAA
jgi:hypothetical protein